jgi:phage-related protein
MVDVTLSLVGSNGDTISLAANSDFILGTGAQGFGIPATAVRIEESAGDGGTWRHSKRGIRDIDLPLVIIGSDRQDVETKLRRLARLLQDKTGPTKIVANYSNGDQLFLEAHYVGGAETQFGADAGSTWCRWVIQMQAPQPYWESASNQTFTISSGNTGRGLLPQLTKMKVSSSTTLGQVSVNSSADVDVFPIWTIRGPISNLVISNGPQTFSFTEAVAPGETITIDTELGTVTDQNGTNRYPILGPAPKLFPIKPGQQVIQVNGLETTTSTYISCNYALRFEVIH